jgi:polyisoprenoid-binding protein YceI
MAVVVVMGLVLGATSLAGAKLAKVGDRAAVSFAAKGPAGMTIVGKTSDLLLRDDGKIVSVSVPLKNLTTGIGLRDQHLREKYLQVDQFPSAELSVDRGSLTPPAASAVSLDAKGVMKIHGKTKTVVFRYTAKKNGQVIEVTGSIRLNIQDYGIPIPSFLGVTVKPDIDIAVSFAAKDS